MNILENDDLMFIYSILTNKNNRIINLAFTSIKSDKTMYKTTSRTGFLIDIVNKNFTEKQEKLNFLLDLMQRKDEIKDEIYDKLTKENIKIIDVFEKQKRTLNKANKRANEIFVDNPKFVSRASVTSFVTKCKQTYKGVIPVSSFIKQSFENNLYPIEEENCHASIIGLVVDYLTRYLLTKSFEESFNISLMGLEIFMKSPNRKRSPINIKSGKQFLKLDPLSEDSIKFALNLAQFDVFLRRRDPFFDYSPKKIMPNYQTISNIKNMVTFTYSIMNDYKNIRVGCTFEGGYTPIIATGDCDFICDDILIDLKVSKSKPSAKDTLQLFIYHLLNEESFNNIKIKKLMIINPRLGLTYTKDISEISLEVTNVVKEAIKIRKISHITDIDQLKYNKKYELKITVKEYLNNYFLNVFFYIFEQQFIEKKLKFLSSELLTLGMNELFLKKFIDSIPEYKDQIYTLNLHFEMLNKLYNKNNWLENLNVNECEAVIHIWLYIIFYLKKFDKCNDINKQFYKLKKSIKEIFEEDEMVSGFRFDMLSIFNSSLYDIEKVIENELEPTIRPNTRFDL